MKTKLFQERLSAHCRKKTNKASPCKDLYRKAFMAGLFLAAFVFGPKAGAQRTLNSGGGTATIGNTTHSYSICEMVLVSTAATANNYFTQGLLQNDDVNLEIHNSQYLAEGLELYPNPVANVVYLQPSFEGGGELDLMLYDLRGRMVGQKQTILQSGLEKQQMDISILQEGTYLLQAILKQDGQVYRHSFKIIKKGTQ